METTTQAGGFRPLSDPEIDHFIAAWRQREEWNALVEYALMVYGDAAENVDVSLHSEGDCEDRWMEVMVRDGTGDYLDYDYTTDWWQRQLEGKAPDATTATDDMRHALLESLPVISEDSVFCVSKPPALPFAVLYVEAP